MKRYNTVDDYIAGAKRWRPQLRRLRDVLRSTELVETVKWGAPCYTHDGKNVVGIGAFKSYFGLWFHQGALLEDPANVLINAQEGKTRALRQWRMRSAKDIKPAIIRRYVKEAIGHIGAGKQVRPRRPGPLVVPDELTNALRRQKGALAAFRSLRPGQQREYANHIAEAKRDDTRARRVDRIVPMIVAGAGLNDRYR